MEESVFWGIWESTSSCARDVREHFITQRCNVDELEWGVSADILFFYLPTFRKLHNVHRSSEFRIYSDFYPYLPLLSLDKA